MCFNVTFDDNCIISVFKYKVLKVYLKYTCSNYTLAQNAKDIFNRTSVPI